MKLRKILTIVLSTVAIMAVASLAFAAEGAAPKDPFIAMGASIGMAIAAAGCGIAQGLGLKAGCEGTARNPEASGKLMTTMILGLAFIESLAIYALVVNLMLIM